MNEIDLNNIYSNSLKIFTIIREEYNNFLSNEQKQFLDNLDIFHFYKIIKNKKSPSIQYIGEMYYLNSSSNVNYVEYLPFLCLACLCGEINPLKKGLIEQELKYLKEKYALNYNSLFPKESEIGEVISKTLLNDVPYKIIFLNSDADIVSYLVEEKGSKTALLYAEVSKKMKECHGDDYGEALDILYNFVSNKVR